MSDYYPVIYQQRWQDELQQEQEGAKDGSKKKRQRQRLALSSFPKLSRLSIHLLQFVAFTIVVVLIWCFVGKYFWKYVLNVKIPEWRIFVRVICGFVVSRIVVDTHNLVASKREKSTHHPCLCSFPPSLRHSPILSSTLLLGVSPSFCFVSWPTCAIIPNLQPCLWMP